jgi:hypothetical protein
LGAFNGVQNQIENRKRQPSLHEREINMAQYDVFISYATEDVVFASEIAGALKARGLRVWIATIEMDVGEKISDSIERGLVDSTFGILLISKAYLTKPWTGFEMDILLHTSIEKNKKLLQIWHNVSKEDVERRHPGLINILAVPSNIGFPNLIAKLMQAMTPRLSYEFEIKAGTGFDYRSILDLETREFIVLGQNIRGLFRQNAQFQSEMQTRLVTNPDFLARIILTVPEFFTGISNSKNPDRDFQAQFAATVYSLKMFHSSLPKSVQGRFQVRFHSGTSSLTAFIRDPEDRRRGMIVFIPKWATEITPGARVFCIIERSNHDALFQSLYGYVPEMYDKALSVSLDEMYRRVEAKCKELIIEWPPT